jgi:tRNA(Ser,Leu) C12 N-acetylase TAN1
MPPVRRTMQDWNVIVSVHERGFKQAFIKLGAFGHVGRTEFFNVLTISVDDVHGMLETLRKWIIEDPQSLSFLSRLMPVAVTFNFTSPEEFEERAREAVLSWVPRLAGRSFHVRLHRRGFKGKISSPAAERLLDEALLVSLEKNGTPGRIAFDNPDAVVAVETIGQRAGMSLWTREDLERFPFIRAD